MALVPSPPLPHASNPNVTVACASAADALPRIDAAINDDCDPTSVSEGGRNTTGMSTTMLRRTMTASTAEDDAAAAASTCGSHVNASFEMEMRNAVACG